jgi:NAD(P)-dependent dehydrogenase (short-subunit alcohol dehydrogenase family)
LATDQPRLAGRVVVVSTESGDVARALASDGAAIVIVGPPDAAGALAGQIEDTGGRACVFTGDLRGDDQRAALAEMLTELF